MPMISLPEHPALFWLLLVGLAATWRAPVASAQPRLLDDFESLEAWRPVVSEGAKLSITQGEGKTGRAMVMEFDLSGVYGYTIAQKPFSIDLPADYEFTFDMRAEAPVNNFEFKLVDDKENVYWIKKLNVNYPKTWAKQRIKKRHLTFAWGPSGGGEIRTVRKIEFVVSVGSGGTGKVYIDNFRFEPLDSAEGTGVRASMWSSSAEPSSVPRIDPGGTLLSGWRSRGERERESIVVSFGHRKEIGGLVLDWGPADFALAYDVMVSDDSSDWTTVYSVRNGNGGRDYIPTPEAEGRFVRIDFNKSSRANLYDIQEIHFRRPEFSSSANAFFRTLAAEAPPGYYPRSLRNEQSYWTVVGVSGDTKEALINEQGQIEVDRAKFSLEPFLYLDDRLVTWKDVSTSSSLVKDYLPIPSVTWNYRNLWKLTVQVVAAGLPGNSSIAVRYSVECNSPKGQGKLYVALRPFQVNPPWQQLNIEGGVSRLDSITYRNGLLTADDVTVVPVTAPARFGSAEFDQGDVVEYLARGTIPTAQQVYDHTGFASAVLEYPLDLRPGENAAVIVAVPFHGWKGSPMPNMDQEGARLYYEMTLTTTASTWERQLDRFTLTLPPSARGVALTLKSNLAYILINRDGPGIQPGSRSYERSWIRDGSLTCAALLRMGYTEEVRQFIDWYAGHQFPSGKIPCVVDARGADAVPEHDSHGQFIYAILQYYLFTHDSLWLRGKLEKVVNTVRYIQSLRAERKTDVYRNGTREQRACYGLVPESISHEGYWDVPRHSYWDNFFVLRGLKDATTIAHILGETALEKEFVVEWDDFQRDLYASMRRAITNKSIDYIPGCVELGDFDATSTTVGLDPGGELGIIPEPQLHNTFDKYFLFFAERKVKGYSAYTPYETRIIGSYVLLGQRDRVRATLDFFMNDHRPPAWNHWAEVVWQQPDTPRYIGDMPHTWVGSDFIRSVRTMFVYERERDTALVLGAGLPEEWVRDPSGVSIAGFATPYGVLDMKIVAGNRSARAEVGGTVHVPAGLVRLVSPLERPIRSATVNGKRARVEGNEVLIERIPATIQVKY